MFSGFESGVRAEVACMFEVRRAGRGTLILEAGKRADGLYIPMIGQLSAISPTAEKLGRCKLGRALGQHSILTRTPSPMTVMATPDVLVLRMSARRFQPGVSRTRRWSRISKSSRFGPSAPSFSLVPAPEKNQRLRAPAGEVHRLTNRLYWDSHEL